MDDGSTDNTAGVVEQFMMAGHEAQLRLVRLHANMGKGAALKMGVRECTGNMVLIVSPVYWYLWNFITL